MILKSLSIANYKSFLEKSDIKFNEGFNILIGANNSGKTSVLDILDNQTWSHKPHKSINNIIAIGAAHKVTSDFELVLTAKLSDLFSLHNQTFYIPVSSKWVGTAPNLKKEDQIELSLSCIDGKRSIGFKTHLDPEIYYYIEGDHNINPAIQVTIHSSENIEFTCTNYAGADFSNRWHTLWSFIFKSIYRFSARRLPNGNSGFQSDATLFADASNLAFCINHFQTNDAEGHKLLCSLVTRIFPDVKWVQSTPSNSGTFQLHCLPVSTELRRQDLAIFIDNMGSGIGNVIAILYVVLTANKPMILAIDEPNSFLHPKALRELLSILNTHGAHHQYVLTGHSADVLTAISPSQLIFLDNQNGFTEIKQVSGDQVNHLRAGLSDLGIRMTDLHGRDRVLWVEGQTEEFVFPALIQHFCPEKAASTAVLRVEHTGLFETKKVNPIEVGNIYKRLSESSCLAPPMVAIILDREGKDPKYCEQLSENSHGIIRFLDQVMIEDYVVHPAAINSVLRDLGEDVELALLENKITELKNENSSITAAKLLETIFSEFTETRHEFRKTRDTPSLFRWCLKHEPEHLKELGQFVQSIMNN